MATPDGIVFSITEFTPLQVSGSIRESQGSFTMERVVSPVTFFTSGSFHGTITSPDAAH